MSSATICPIISGSFVNRLSSSCGSEGSGAGMLSYPSFLVGILCNLRLAPLTDVESAGKADCDEADRYCVGVLSTWGNSVDGKGLLLRRGEVDLLIVVVLLRLESMRCDRVESTRGVDLMFRYCGSAISEREC